MAWSCSGPVGTDDLGAVDVTIWISIPLFAPHALPVPVKPGKSRQGSTVVADTSPWPQAIQTPDAEKPFFAKRSEPNHTAPMEISFGPFRLLPTQLLLSEGDKPVQLGSRALEILIVLLERPGELISKQELIDRVWPNVFVGLANLTVH